MKLIYPAIFYPWDDEPGYTVEVPDLPGCVSEGATLAEAIFMGTDAASGWVLTELEDGKPVPKASALQDIHPDAGGFVSMLVLDMDVYGEKYGNKVGTGTLFHVKTSPGFNPKDVSICPGYFF
jgi:predicted RNase H-like HicB family nuclease